MRVLVSGDRDWDDPEAIRRELSKLPSDTIIIHGAARGADSLADDVAKELGFERDPYPALWEKYYKAAGPIRNQQMIDEGKPDLILAFHPNIQESKGTKDMIKRAVSHSIPFQIFSS